MRLYLIKFTMANYFIYIQFTVRYFMEFEDVI